MVLIILALVLGLVTYEFMLPADISNLSPAIEGWRLAVFVIVPKVLLGVIYWMLCAATYQRLTGDKAYRAMMWMEWETQIYRASIVAVYAMDLTVGLLIFYRVDLGMRNAVLIDEVLIMLPAIAMMIWGWWCYYPLDRRLREASVMRKADQGEPIYPIWSRGQYLLAQFRHQVLLVLAPMLILLGWTEFIYRHVDPNWTWLTLNMQVVLVFAGLGMVLLFSPFIIRFLWDTSPLPEGELRDRLTEMCKQYQVGVRDLLLWRTFGGMINGAVMGAISQVRYILLTDALLDNMKEKHVEAVMAHELAHVRKHHLPWLMIAAGSSLALLNIVMFYLAGGSQQVAYGNEAGVMLQQGGQSQTVVATSFAGSILLWIPVFGWVSRRFERQADTFAVKHLSMQRFAEHAERTGDTTPRIDAESAETMAGALRQVAELNHIPMGEGRFDRLLFWRHWRHGSIQWRINYLHTLEGQPIDDLAIDWTVRYIKLASFIAMSALAVAYTYMPDGLPRMW